MRDLVFLSCATLLALAACGKAADVHAVHAAPPAPVVSAPFGTTPLIVEPRGRAHGENGKETSAAWAASADIHDPEGVVAVAFTQSNCRTSSSCARWARRGGGGTWEAHGDNEPSWAVPAGFKGSDGAAPLRWGPDPLLLAIPRAGVAEVEDRFVYVGMMSTSAHADQDIFVAVSDDGARTFKRFALVTANGGGGGIDRPAAAVDPVDGTVWVWWANGKQYWVDSVQVPLDGASPPVIGTPDPFPLPAAAARAAHGALAVRHVGTGGLSGSQLLFAWPDDYGAGDDCPAKATTARGELADAAGLNTFPIQWFLSVKTFGLPVARPAGEVGNGWAHHPITTAPAGSFQTCVDPARRPGSKGIPFFGVGAIPAIAVDGDTGEVFVALARSSLLKPTSIHLYSSTDLSTWDDFAIPGDANRWRPTIGFLPAPGGAGGAGGAQLGLAWYEVRKPATAGGGDSTRWATIYDLASKTWRVPTMISAATTGTEQIPWSSSGSNGDYEGMAVDVAGRRFIDTWPDNRTGGSQPMIWTARFH
ncbi:MAG TPA: hypothetical protein VHE35_21695 [Kofleriaceae bacterium]|nr:hypothetical protein [Kofleriaceae bacterium]